MSRYSLTEREIVDVCTGLVVESLAVKQDFGAATVGCRRCADGTTLASGDRVTVALTCYEGHSWEIEGVFCADHGIDSVTATMGVRAEHQAVVAAVLEQSGYLPPDGNFEADALALGAVDVLDYSPSDEGY
jgi:hypothetical protein